MALTDKIKLVALTVLTICIALLSVRPLFATESTSSSVFNIAVQSTFSMEFYNDQNVLYNNVIPFTNVDPSKSVVYPDGRSENDGKSDAAVICKSNLGVAWFLKINLTPSPPLTADKVKYYISQPYNRNTGSAADGSLTQSPQWYSFSDTPTTVYTSGFYDKSNMPFGTLVTFNYSLNPTGLEAGKGYSALVIYTMTTSP